MTDEERPKIKSAVPLWQININDYMKTRISPDDFVDVQALLCGPDKNYCNIFTDSGNLKTFDRTHLTPAGAKYYGNQLMINGVFSPVLE